jgi:hypothetical protein
MSVTIYRGKVLTKEDLNIYIQDENSVYFSPFSITYTIYKVISDRFYNQECGEEPIVETLETIPIPFGIGKFFAAWNMAKDLNIGKYRIKWHLRRYSDSPIYEEIEEFDVINRTDKMNYSVINGGMTGSKLPDQMYGNNNLCAG